MIKHIRQLTIVVLVISCLICALVGCSKDDKVSDDKANYGVWGDTNLKDMVEIEKRINEFRIDGNFTMKVECYSYDDQRNESYSVYYVAMCDKGVYDNNNLYLVKDNKVTEQRIRDEQGNWVKLPEADKTNSELADDIMIDFMYNVMWLGHGFVGDWNMQGKEYWTGDDKDNANVKMTINKDGVIKQGYAFSTNADGETIISKKYVTTLYDIGSTNMDKMMALESNGESR